MHVLCERLDVLGAYELLRHLREQRQLLEKCAATALNSKLIAGQKDFFSKMVVDAVMSLDELLSLKMIGIKKVQGGALEVCFFSFLTQEETRETALDTVMGSDRVLCVVLTGFPVDCRGRVQEDLLLRRV